MDKLPERKHVYQNHTLNSKNWDNYVPRDDDIIVATPYKSGTTWMQTIVQRLIFLDTENRNLWEISPWIELRSRANAIDRIEEQTHRRSVKTHLPLDGLPYFPQIKYIVVNRDARDIFMSFWNHYSNFTDAARKRLNESSHLVGNPMPPAPENIHKGWQNWMTKGWFEWETEGYPWWSCLRHVQTWWDFRRLPNILHVHYNDLLHDLEGEIRRVADYLDIVIPEELVAPIVESVTFDSMKQQGEQIMGEMASVQNGVQTFFNKGTNGRWHDVLTADELKLYQAAVQRELTPNCARWLENGRMAI